MKPFSLLFKTGMRLLVVTIGLLLGQTLPAAVSLTVTPSVISNQYTGMIALAITGLTNGETVTIDKFLDANTNGVIDGGDLLGQRFELTDGQVSLIGGKTNINVPGDLNPAVSNITALLNFESINIEHIAGNYLFKLSSPIARFSPVTNAFNITNSAYLQSFTGQVRSNGTTTAVANAIVVLLGTNSNGNNFVGGTVADNSGNYMLKAAPGTYQLAAFKSNFVGDFTASAVSLGGGGTVTTNVNVIPATRTISGRVADAGNNTPLPGILVFLDSTDGFVAISFTDTNGNFNAPVTASNWKVKPQEQDAALHGYVRLQNSIRVSTSTGNVSGVNILFPKGTAMFYGSIKDDLGNPLPGFDVYGQDQDTYQYESDGVSDANGNYAAAALAGNWYADLSGDDLRLTNYVFSGNIGTTVFTSGQAVRQDFLLKRATNHITGSLKDNHDTPISGVRVNANANVNGTNYQAGNAITDGSGNYSMNVINGNWNVSVNCCGDCGDGLSSNYQCPNNQNVNISNGNGVVNFIAQLCTGVEITTADLANGEVGVYYNAFLNAASCNNSFTWSLNSGSLPAGLQLNSGGQIFGTPNSSGTFNFSAHVIDGNSNTTNKNLSITILAAVQITTTSLPPGMVSQNIHTNLQATGGQPPYDWNIISGSLPPGVLFNTGLIDGIPTNSGTFNFTVQVIDQLGGTTNQSLTLTITGSAQPLQVTTTSLPNGTLNTFYSQLVNATGGQQPYSWSLAPGSAPLPPGLNLSSGGSISGTPTNSGTFFFNLRATDALSATADGLLSIYIPTPPLQITTLSLPNAQQGAGYTNQLQASGGQLPYSWSLAPGSLSLPPNLSLSTGGVISGMAATNGTFFFIVRVTDGSFAFTNRSLSLTLNPKPTLAALNRTGNQFQLRLSGATGQNYTIQFSTSLANPSWLSLLITNPSAASVTILDPNATNATRFYRAWVGP